MIAAEGGLRSRILTNRDFWLCAGALSVALSIRVAVVVASRRSYVPVYDSADFNRIAASIATGHGFGPTAVPGGHGPSAFRTPLYPALLGLVYAIFGTHLLAARLFTAFISTLAVASIGALAWRLAGRRVGFIALSLAAIYPPLILAGYGLNYEVLFVALECLALLAFVEWRRHPERMWLLVAGGLLTGLTVLCRETAVLLLVPAWWLVVSALRKGPGTNLAKSLAVVTVCAIVVVAPWTIRNESRLHAFIPVSDSPGEALAGEYNATTAHDNTNLARWIVPTSDPYDLGVVERIGTSWTEVQFTSRLEKAGVKYLEHHPGELPKVFAGNTVRLFSLRGFRDSSFYAPLIGWSVRFSKIANIGFWIVALLAAVGVVTRRFRAIPAAIWVFPVLVYLTLAFTVGIEQYRAPLDPFFILLASMTILYGYDRWFGTRVREQAGAEPLGPF